MKVNENVTLAPSMVAVNPYYGGHRGLLVGRIRRDLGDDYFEVFWGTHCSVNRTKELRPAPDGAVCGARLGG